MPHLSSLVESLGANGFYRKVCELLDANQLSVDDFSYYELAEACGVLPGLRGLRNWTPPENVGEALCESNPGLNTHLFQIVTGELIGRKVLEGYEDTSGFVGDQLVTTIPSRRRGQRLAGFTALAGPSEVAEGHAYEESSFTEKYVTTEETKKGRILSINEELIGFDQTGEINRRAMQLGYYLRQERERTILRAVTDADTTQRVYRPNGTSVALYATDGTRRNYVGVGNTTSSGFNTAIPLASAADIEQVLNYRATQVIDDRVDGTPRPILAPTRQLLVPEALRATARGIVNATEVSITNGGATRRLANALRGELEVLSSPFLDEQGADGKADWYLGDFRRQFVWTEIWPVQTFLQRADGPAAFERDVVLRIKVRYFGGVSAVDTVFVTKVDGV